MDLRERRPATTSLDSQHSAHHIRQCTYLCRCCHRMQNTLHVALWPLIVLEKSHTTLAYDLSTGVRANHLSGHIRPLSAVRRRRLREAAGARRRIDSAPERQRFFYAVSPTPPAVSKLAHGSAGAGRACDVISSVTSDGCERWFVGPLHTEGLCMVLLSTSAGWRFVIRLLS